jgi:hypothetical protein
MIVGVDKPHLSHRSGKWFMWYRGWWLPLKMDLVDPMDWGVIYPRVFDEFREEVDRQRVLDRRGFR